MLIWTMENCIWLQTSSAYIDVGIGEYRMQTDVEILNKITWLLSVDGNKKNVLILNRKIRTNIKTIFNQK